MCWISCCVNADIASREMIPACQDTGICTVFVTLGQEVLVRGDLLAAIQEGVRLGYEEGYLRKSVCDPVTRINTGTNVPAVIHVEVAPAGPVPARLPAQRAAAARI
jgi:fumarate hydratase subunit alpha